MDKLKFEVDDVESIISKSRFAITAELIHSFIRNYCAIPEFYSNHLDRFEE